MVAAREYHERTKHTPRSVRSTPGLNWENKPRLYKIYEGLPSVALADSIVPPVGPTLRALAESVTDAGQPVIDREVLTALCWLSAGITKRIDRGEQTHYFRAAACTGALYHIDLYLVVGELEDLAAGVYHFEPRTLSLDVLREGDYRDGVVEATGRHAQTSAAPMVAILTSTWWRNAWKYGERTYRHAFWDAGTVAANLLATATGFGLPASVVTGFVDDHISSLLGITPAAEAPVALIPVGDGDKPMGSSDPEDISPATRPLSPNPREFELITEAYRQSMLDTSRTVRDWRENQASSPIPPEPSGRGREVELAPVGDEQASKAPVHRVIRRRGSCRRYERESLNFRKFSTVLDRACRVLPLDVGLDVPLCFTKAYLSIHDIDEIPPGKYVYHPERQVLECLESGEFRSEAGRLALNQRLAADAAVCVYFLADLEALTDWFGNRGYRVAQLAAALYAGRLYLAAYSHRDLGATGLTFFDDLVTEFFEPRSEGEDPMFLWTLGRPAE